MRINASTPEEYIAALPEERKASISRLRKVINENLPEGFKEEMSYGMIGWVVPHTLYPDGYHCDPRLPLPFMSIASQKNFIALYHMGMYATKELNDWFVTEYAKHCKYKLDMGKSCIRFNKLDDIPYELIADLVSRMSAEEWMDIYEQNLKG